MVTTLFRRFIAIALVLLGGAVVFDVWQKVHTGHAPGVAGELTIAIACFVFAGMSWKR